MQRYRQESMRRLVSAIVVVCALGSGSSFAQSAKEQVPDYAALIGVPMTASEVVRSRSVASSEHEVQRRIGAAGLRRSAAQRAASEGLNRVLAKMPETTEQALREAAANKTGPMIVRTSRQQIQPMYALPADGGATASHGADVSSVR